MFDMFTLTLMDARDAFRRRRQVPKPRRQRSRFRRFSLSFSERFAAWLGPPISAHDAADNASPKALRRGRATPSGLRPIAFS